MTAHRLYARNIRPAGGGCLGGGGDLRGICVGFAGDGLRALSEARIHRQVHGERDWDVRVYRRTGEPKRVCAKRPLSVHLAFVIQFRTDTQVEMGHLTGRVEHVTSRQVVEFNSLEALLAFVARVLREVRETPASF